MHPPNCNVVQCMCSRGYLLVAVVDKSWSIFMMISLNASAQCTVFAIATRGTHRDLQ